ncbi:MAG TPA: cyclic pyranopterin monophosphate synthase MoaC [Longimicrobiaceae bacterium]|nr:cyclic pyranopterin monophosphate synthase MoaC [Longimicrobiaceae bacterium]
MNQNQFSHLDEGGAPRMVDVAGKQVTARRAVAEGWIKTTPETAQAVLDGKVTKGSVLTTAQVAGIMAAKRTSDLIPLCHPLPLSAVEMALEVDLALPGVRARAEARVDARTGVEMEALTAVSVALLTVYDMCKALDRAMEVGGIRLLRKEGGKSGSWTRERE